jgi:hypothetical protein
VDEGHSLESCISEGAGVPSFWAIFGEDELAVEFEAGGHNIRLGEFDASARFEWVGEQGFHAPRGLASFSLGSWDSLAVFEVEFIV